MGNFRREIILIISLMIIFSMQSLALQQPDSPARREIRRGSPQIRNIEAITPSEVATGTIQEKFRVGSRFGDRDEFNITLKHPGQLKLKATWRGTASNLALILNGPGQEGYYARKDGISPLEINFRLTQELLNRGSEWKVSIINFSRKGSAVGTISIEYPVGVLKIHELKPNELKILKLDKLVLGKPQSGTIEKTVLEDGTIQIRYPDGTIKQHHPDGTTTIITPDGKAMKTIFSQVQPATPPSLPSDLPDDDLNTWLENVNMSLLNTIKSLLSNNQNDIDNYMKLEIDKTLYEIINLRIRCIGILSQ